MRRRDVICGLGSLALSVAPLDAAWSSKTASISRLDALAPAIQPELNLQNAHTGERFTGAFFDGAGYVPQELDAVDWFLRDWRQDETKRFDSRLLWALAAIRQAAQADGHSGEVVILSGFRTQKTNTFLRSRGIGVARNSFHLKARAIDFILPGAPIHLIARYARWLQVGGTGHYPNNFVHIDTGPERTWNG